ncbi:MAG TPA: hypothetical protein DDX47_03105, partial [Candidatus Jacksonbacteria bacterium]|nr:hypothetical protein [Candidatus Jacksonbacteria bacterium]HCC50055.1 hypothetical protein [Candidatus Jacksonbacteria bacterium]HCE48590.1 hypothetical protein [Candidatus Jacksonbacteria bacterium]
RLSENKQKRQFVIPSEVEGSLPAGRQALFKPLLQKGIPPLRVISLWLASLALGMTVIGQSMFINPKLC